DRQHGAVLEHLEEHTVPTLVGPDHPIRAVEVLEDARGLRTHIPYLSFSTQAAVNRDSRTIASAPATTPVRTMPNARSPATAARACPVASEHTGVFAARFAAARTGMTWPDSIVCSVNRRPIAASYIATPSARVLSAAGPADSVPSAWRSPVTMTKRFPMTATVAVAVSSSPSSKNGIASLAISHSPP